LTHVDGEQHEDEKKFITELTHALEIPDAEAAELISAADERAKRFLNLL
jgi:uncharacterized tellurite resistance protein B-like protein